MKPSAGPVGMLRQVVGVKLIQGLILFLHPDRLLIINIQQKYWARSRDDLQMLNLLELLLTKMFGFYQIQIFGSNQMRGVSFLAIFAVLSLNVSGFEMCSIIQLDDYEFDLSSLKIQTIAVPGLIIKLFCQPTNCSSLGYNSTSVLSNLQNAYLLQIYSNICNPMTINKTIIQNYGYIDPNAPEKGIKISFPPYLNWDPIPDANKTNSFFQTSYFATFSLYCDSATTQSPTCTRSQGTNSTEIRNGVSYTTLRSQVSCSFYDSRGCPNIKNNNFWKFLLDNKIWFMIVLWVVSLFELFMGYFVIRLTILIYGIMTGAMAGIIFSAQNYEDFFYNNDAYGLSVFIVLLSLFMGLMFGIALLTLPKLGYVNIGFWNAVIFSLLLQNGALYATGSMAGFYITLGVSAFVMTAISLLGFRKFIIASTSFISAFWIVRTLGFVLPYYPNEFTATKLFVINKTTPWQFYLYLLSMIIISVLGCVFQFCWYKKKGKDHGNKGYYLEDDDTFKNKLKKLVQFDDIKKMISAGKEQVMFLKNLVANRSSELSEKSEENQQKQKKGKFIQMKSIKNSQFEGNKITKKSVNIESSDEEAQAQQSKIKKSVNKSDLKKRGQGEVFLSIDKIINKQKGSGNKQAKKVNNSQDGRKGNLSSQNELAEVKKRSKNNSSANKSNLSREKGKLKKYEEIEGEFSSEEDDNQQRNKKR